jgi:hypothetical protein
LAPRLRSLDCKRIDRRTSTDADEPFCGFSQIDTILYFSFTTLTTTGFGDITPMHPFARSLTNLEAVIGQLYPATILARLVTLELEHRRR